MYPSGQNFLFIYNVHAVDLDNRTAHEFLLVRKDRKSQSGKWEIIAYLNTDKGTSVFFYQTVRRNIPEDSRNHIRRLENLKAHLQFKHFINLRVKLNPPPLFSLRIFFNGIHFFEADLRELTRNVLMLETSTDEHWILEQHSFNRCLVPSSVVQFFVSSVKIIASFWIRLFSYRTRSVFILIFSFQILQLFISQ